MMRVRTKEGLRHQHQQQQPSNDNSYAQDMIKKLGRALVGRSILMSLLLTK